ncbi:hypothetical protein [Streptomyces sp. NPDC049881]|uniref:hypothetical protein n=1 Tax=Streptomyces sp. NPDC049881 TaxID=3155778 RepID=UPI00343297ED
MSSALRAVLVDADGPAPEEAAGVAATTLRAHLGTSDAFTPGEAALLDEWLERVQRHRPTS